MGQDNHDFVSLDEGWLRAKPGRKWHHVSPRLAAWVADMDFRPAPEITTHLASILDGGDVGYPERDDRNRMRAVGAFVGWMEQRHGWSPDPDGIREWNDVVQAVQAVLHVATRPGDGVVLHVPAYPPFFDAIEQTGCRPVTAPAHIHGDTVAFDHDELERTMARDGAKVMILCNPQNPTGHVFTRDELVRLAEIAVRHDLLVISDEIHADILFDGHRHIPFATVPGAADRTVTVTSASKSFNLAGLRYAVTHCGAGWIEERFASLPHHLFGATNIFGSEAAYAAWTVGTPWFDAVHAHLGQMRDATVDLVRDRLPGVTVHRPDATYLAWLDCSGTAIAADPHAAFASAGVETSPGTGFGPGGEGHVRLNFATSPAVLTRIIDTMAVALR